MSAPCQSHGPPRKECRRTVARDDIKVEAGGRFVHRSLLGIRPRRAVRPSAKLGGRGANAAVLRNQRANVVAAGGRRYAASLLGNLALAISRPGASVAAGRARRGVRLRRAGGTDYSWTTGRSSAKSYCRGYLAKQRPARSPKWVTAELSGGPAGPGQYGELGK